MLDNDGSKNDRVTYIYLLSDPRDGTPRYIGKADNPRRRLSAHVCNSKRKENHCHCWIAGLVEKGLLPNLTVLQEVEFSGWQEAERGWISHFRSKDFPLVNTLDGGECGPTDEVTRAKMSAAKKGRKMPWLHTPEAVAKSSVARTGKKRAPASEQRREKMRRLHAEGRYVFTEEQKRKISESKKGIKRPPSVAESVRKAHTGKKHSEQTKKKHSESNKKRYSDPKARAAHSERMKQWWAERKAAKTPTNDPVQDIQKQLTWWSD